MVLVSRDASRRNILFNHRHDLVKNGQGLGPSFALPVPTIDWLSAIFLVVFSLLKYIENLREVQHDSSVDCRAHERLPEWQGCSSKRKQSCQERARTRPASRHCHRLWIFLVAIPFVLIPVV